MPTEGKSFAQLIVFSSKNGPEPKNVYVVLVEKKRETGFCTDTTIDSIWKDEAEANWRAEILKSKASKGRVKVNVEAHILG